MALKALEKKAHDMSEELLEQALSKISDKLLDELIPYLDNLCLPDYEGQAPTCLSTLNYETSDVRTGKLTDPESTIDIDGNKIHWMVKNIGISGSGNWKYSYLCVFGGGGNFDLTATCISTTTSVAITRENGRFGVKLLECKCTLGKVEFHVDGGALCACVRCMYHCLARPELYKTLLRLLKEGIEEVLEKTVPGFHLIEKYWPFDLPG